MRNRLNQIREIVHKAEAAYNLAADLKKTLEASIVDAEDKYSACKTVKDVISNLAIEAQKDIGDRIANIVNLALAAVWNDPYTLHVDFVTKRNSTEADIYFTRDVNRCDPLDDTGGGVVDITAFALRLAIWSLNKSAPIFILDEPFRNLSVSKQERAGDMLKMLSDKLGIQIIMVSHNEAIIAGADRLITVDSGNVVIERK